MSELIPILVSLIGIVGIVIGGWLGAKVAVAKGNAWIKRLFIFVVILSGLKLLFRTSSK